MIDVKLKWNYQYRQINIMLLLQPVYNHQTQFIAYQIEMMCSHSKHAVMTSMLLLKNACSQPNESGTICQTAIICAWTCPRTPFLG